MARPPLSLPVLSQGLEGGVSLANVGVLEDIYMGKSSWS